MDLSNNDRYEQLVAENTVVELGRLCPTCTSFVRGSALIRRLMQGRNIRIGTTETTTLCSTERLKAGYRGGCHLCALVWEHAGGRLLDPEQQTIAATEVAVEIRARNIDKEYERDTQQLSSTRRYMWKLNPSYM